MHLRTIDSRASGHSRPSGRARSDGGGLYMCCVKMPMKFSAWKGISPASISYNMTPSE